MCGIAGIVGQSSSDELEAIDSRVMRRGPDGQGLFSESPIRLCHRRLAILGLGDSGRQPAASPSGRFILAFNGEIYNHRELRQRTSLSSRNWLGSGDAETLATLLDFVPIADIVDLLRGMFAIAVWDRSSRELHLFRDRFGIKPLYYAHHQERFAFASTADALSTFAGQRSSVSRQSLHALMSFGHISGRKTLWEKVYEVLPGEHVAFSEPENALSRRKFSNLTHRAIEQLELGKSCALDTLHEQLFSELEKAVQDATLSDVPVGALLSGGIDSRLVASLHAKSRGRISTFTIGFEDGSLDESAIARESARQLGSEHHSVRLSQESALATIGIAEAAFGEPFGDSSSVPMIALSQLASRAAKVVVSGDGGDELFGGYRTYTVAVNAAASRQTGQAPEHTVYDLYRSRATNVTLGASEDLLLSGWKSRWETSAQLGDQIAYRMMLLDVEHHLPFGILHKVDRASMHFGLEVRPPLLSESVFDLAWRIHGANGGYTTHFKAPLVAALNRTMKQDIEPIPKSGLSIPLSEWLDGPLRDWALDLIDPHGMARDGFLDPSSVRDLWERHERGERVSYSLWPILMFQSWRYRNQPSLL